MILKFICRYFRQTRAFYFSGWENKAPEKTINDYKIGNTTHPATIWMAGAKTMSKTEAEKAFPLFKKYMEENYGKGICKIVKNNRAMRAGWRG